jgi:hypothetical protein
MIYRSFGRKRGEIVVADTAWASLCAQSGNNRGSHQAGCNLQPVRSVGTDKFSRDCVLLWAGTALIATRPDAAKGEKILNFA